MYKLFPMCTFLSHCDLNCNQLLRVSTNHNHIVMNRSIPEAAGPEMSSILYCCSFQYDLRQGSHLLLTNQAKYIKHLLWDGDHANLEQYNTNHRAFILVYKGLPPITLTHRLKIQKRPF